MDYMSYLNKRITLTEGKYFDFLLSILGKTGLFMDVVSLSKNPELFKDWLEDNKEAYDKAMTFIGRDVEESVVNEGLLDYPKNVLMMLIILLRLISSDDAFAGDLKNGYDALKNKYKEYSKDIQDMELDKKFDKVKEKSQPFLDKMKDATKDVKEFGKEVGKEVNRGRENIIQNWKIYKDEQKKKMDSVPVTPADREPIKKYEI